MEAFNFDNDTTQLVPFQFESNQIRIITHPDGTWSVAARDVAMALEYTRFDSNLIASVPDEWKGTNPIRTPGGMQEMLTLTEQGLYFFIGRSDKPKALPFQKWVYGEVLPTIRKTGGYQAKPKAKTKRTVDAVVLKYRQARVIASSYMDMAKLFGADVPMARAIAADVVRQETGVNVQPLLAGNTVKEAPLNPTALGKMAGMSAKKMNATLALQGFQERSDESGDWVPTEKGRKYATCNPYKSPNSEHSGYRTMWYPDVLEALEFDVPQLTD